MERKKRRLARLIFILITLMIFTAVGYAGIEDQKRYDSALDHYQKTKNYDQAIKDLNEAIKLKSENPPAYSLLGWCYVKKGRLDLALPQFQKAVELDRDNIPALGGLALCHYAFGKYKEAIEVAKKVELLTSRWINSASFEYFKREDRNLLYDFWSDSYEIIGKASLHLGRFEDAVTNLGNASKSPASWSNIKEIRMYLAQSYYGMKKYEHAQEEYTRILSQDSQFIEALVGRGWASVQRSKFDEAEKDFLAALKINPKHASAIAGMVEVRKYRTTTTKNAWERLYEQEYDKAISAFKEALAKYPNWSILYDGLGWSYYYKGMMSEAEESFDKALKLDPWLPTSLTGRDWALQWKFTDLNAAFSLLNNQQYDKAITAFQEILKDKSGRLPGKELWRVHNGLGWAFYYKRDYGKAGESFKESIKQFPKSSDSLKGLGFTYYAQKQYDLAIRELSQSLIQYGVQADVQTTIGWSYYQKKEYPRAIEAFEKALKIFPSWTDAFYGLGITYHQRGEKEKALSSFRSGIWILPGYMATNELKDIIEKEKTYWPLYDDWGWSYFYQWMFPEAEEYFTIALKKFPDRPGLLRGLGYAQYRLKKYDSAIINLEKSWKLDPKLEPVKEYVTIPNIQGVHFIQSDAQNRIAWSYYFKKDYDKAMAIFKEVATRHPNWANSRAGLAWCYFMKNSYDEAEKEFKEAQKADPNYPDSYNGLNAIAQVRYALANKAWGYYYAGDYDQAIREFKAAMDAKVQLLPEREVSRLPLGIGWSLYWKRDYKAASEEFKKVLAKVSDDFSAHQGMGYIHFQNKDFDQAIAELQASLKSYPGNIDSQSNLGWAYLRKGDYDNSIKAFEVAIKINPSLADPYKGLAWSQWKKGKKVEARDNFAKAIAIYPGYVGDEEFEKTFKGTKEGADLYLKLGWSYYQKGLYKEAKQKFEEVLSQISENPDALSGLGYLSYYQKQYDQAIPYFEKVLVREPSWSNVRAYLAWSYYFKENYKRAKEEFEKIVTAYPNVSSYQSGLGWSLYRLKDIEGARKAFRTSLRLNPYDPSALEGIKVLGQK
jgi:tetratricopeptide (TPR) repeat protein